MHLKKISLNSRLIWYIIVFVTIWGQNLPGIFIAGIKLFPVRIISIIFFIYSIIDRLRNKNTFIKKEDLFLILFFLIGCLTFVWTEDRNTTGTALVVYFTSIVVLYIYKKYAFSEENIKIISEAFYVNTIVICVLGLYESFTGKYLYISYEYYLRDMNFLGLYYPKTIFFNTNDLTVFLLCCLPITLICIEGKKSGKFLKLLIMGLSFSVIILTGSRTGMIDIVLFIVLDLLYSEYIKKGTLKTILLIIIFSLIAILTIGFFPIEVLDKYNNNTNFFDNSDRTIIWNNIFELSKNSGFMGIGPGMVGVLNNLPAHNLFLEIFCEFGIIGFFCFIMFLVGIFPKFKYVKSKIFVKYFAIFFWIFLSCIMCSSSMQGYYFIWAIWGIVYAYYNELEKNTILRNMEAKDNE